MIYSSLAVLALSASAMANPLSHLVHLHPRHAQPDTRITFALRNNGICFRDVRIDGRVYTVQSHGSILVKAPVGTVVYADSQLAHYKRGDAIVELTAKLENQQVVID
jgi:hypothetical protein